MVDQIITYLGLAIGILGIVIAIYQSNEKRKLIEFSRVNNWLNYQRIDNTTGITQSAKNLYLQKHKDNIDADILDNLSRADAHGQDLVKEAIRQIQMTEPSFSAKDFERWRLEGKLTEDRVAFFKRFSIAPSHPSK